MSTEGGPSATTRPPASTIRPIAKADGQRQIVKDRDDPGAAPGDRTQKLHRAQLVQRVERRDGLVGQKHLGLDRERARQQHARPFAAGKRAERSRAQVRDVRRGERGLDRGMVGGARRREGAAMRQAPQSDEMVDPQGPMRRPALREEGDAPGQFAAPEFSRPLAVIARLARLQRLKIGEDAHQRRLAGPVRTDESDHLAGADGAVDARERALLAEADGRVRRDDAHQASRRRRSIRLNRNGAPTSAVTTPNLSSGWIGARRTPMSAQSSAIAPPNPLTRSSRPGRWPTSGRRDVRNHQTDEADGAGDGDRASDRQRRSRDQRQAQARRDRSRGWSRCPRPGSARRAPARRTAASAQPASISGSASQTWGRLRSVSEPISQNMISKAA